MTFIDPSEPDPRFPDRPTHPDYIRLSTIVQNLDAEAEAGANPFELAGVDEDSMIYLIRNRLAILRIPMTSTMAAFYLDAFLMGKRYAEEAN